LNLSKTAGSGSVGEHSGSEAGASHRSQDDEEEEDNLSEDLEDENEKDEGWYILFVTIFGLSLDRAIRSAEIDARSTFPYPIVIATIK
jgi:hypothetical protein